MKVRLIAAALGVAASPALAGSIVYAEPDTVIYDTPVFYDAPEPEKKHHGSDWTGFYGGIHLGWGTHQIEGALPTDSGNGVVLGGQLGYDYAYGKFLIGLGLDITAVEMELDLGGGWLDNMGRARVRSGFTHGKWLIYSTGGAVYGDATLFPTLASEDWGWFYGGGVEYMLDEHKSFGIEALHHTWDDFDGSNTDLDATTLEGRLNWRF